MAAHRDPPAGRGVDPGAGCGVPQRDPRPPAVRCLPPHRAARAAAREAAGLRWCDIDLDAATAIITCQLQQYDGRLVLCPPKTARSERAVALDRTTVAVLHARKAAQNAERAAAGEDYHDSGYVFTCLNGDPMAPDRLSRTFRRLSDAAGLPPVRLHDLRHGAASLALAAGVDTADTYISIALELALSAAEAVIRLVLRAGRCPPGGGKIRRPSATPRAVITAA